jgi:hypothetical protein
MQTLEFHLEALIQQGSIDYQTAVDASIYPQDISKPDQQAVALNGGGRR